MVGESENTMAYQRDAGDCLETFIVPYLKENGKIIGNKAALGDKTCKEIIQLYQMVYDFKDHISIGLLYDEIQSYIRKEKENE